MRITCPLCRYSKEISLSAIPPSTVNATCPNCAHRFPYASPSKTPPSQMEENYPKEAVFSVNSGQGVPWERRGELGLLPAFLLSIVRCLFSPQSFFRAMPPQGRTIPALLFLLLLIAFQMLMLFFWDVSGMSPFLSEAGGRELDRIGTSWSADLPLLLPWIFVIIPIILGYILQITLRLVGAKPDKTQNTLQALLYGSTPSIFLIIPIIGFWIGIFWCLWTWITTVKEVHQISYWKATPAVILALLFTIGLGTGLIFFSVPIIFGQ